MFLYIWKRKDYMRNFKLCKSTIWILNATQQEGCCNDIVRREHALGGLTDPAKSGTHAHNTPPARLENLSCKAGSLQYYLYYFSFVGIIASLTKQNSFQNHKSNHWNLIGKWTGWDWGCNWGSLGSTPTSCPLHAVLTAHVKFLFSKALLRLTSQWLQSCAYG